MLVVLSPLRVIKVELTYIFTRTRVIPAIAFLTAIARYFNIVVGSSLSNILRHTPKTSKVRISSLGSELLSTALTTIYRYTSFSSNSSISSLRITL